jgi:phytoene synthase
VTEEEILGSKYTENYRALAGSVAARARYFYQLARQSLPAEDRKSMVAAELMGAVYWQLLKKLEAGQFNVFGDAPVRIHKAQKLALIVRAWLRLLRDSRVPGYGTP